MNTEMSAADIAAITGNNNNGMWDNGSWWIIILFLFAFVGWGGNNGFGGGGSGASNNYVLASDFATIQRQLSDGFNAQERRTDAIVNGICDLGYTQQSLSNATNMSVMQGFNNVQSQLAQCCCDIREGISGVNYNNAIATAQTDRQIERGFADTNYNMATQNCATLQAIDKVGDRVIDYLANKEAQNLRDENQALRLAASQQAQNNFLVNALRPAPVPSFSVPNPYAYNGCCNGCGC